VNSDINFKGKTFLKKVKLSFLELFVVTSLVYMILIFQKTRLFYAAGWPDPFYYIGYSVDMESLQIRNGTTYTATRIPAILLIMVKNFLGIPNQLFRAILISICVIALMKVLINVLKLEWIKSLLVSVLVVNNLFLLRHLADDYALNFAIPLQFILLTILFRQIYVRQEKINSFLLGFIVVLILLCNLSTFIAIFPFMFTLLLLERNRMKKRVIARELRMILIGILLATLLNMLFSYLLAGPKSLFNFLYLLKSAVEFQSEQEGAAQTLPLNYVMGYILVFLFSLIIFSKNQNLKLLEKINEHRSSNNNTVKRLMYLVFNTSIEVKIQISVFTTFLFGILWHEVVGGIWLSYSFYAALYLPYICLILATQLKNANRTVLLLALILEIVLMKFISIEYLSDLFDSVTNIRLATIAFLAGICLLRFFNNLFKSLLPILTVFILILSPLNQTWQGFNLRTGQLIDGEYLDFKKSWNLSYQEDVQDLAFEFSKFVKQNLPKGESLWVVYPQEVSWLTSIASTQLYGYSCFHCADLEPRIKTVSDLSKLSKFQDEFSSRSYTLVIVPKYVISYKDTFFKETKNIALVTGKSFSTPTVRLTAFLYRTN